MDPIAKIRARLTGHPGVRFEEGDGWIRVLPASPEGFIVEFHLDGGAYVVAFDAWHERFHDVEEALSCFAFGLSDTCRLKIESRGGKPLRWTVEHFRDGEWMPDSTTGLLLFRFWRSPRVEYRRNSLIKGTPAP